MQMPSNDGGPAFPVHPEAHNRSDAECSVLSGMTLRDWFAWQALLSMRYNGATQYKDDAESCYKMADAMLKARQQ